MSFMKEYKLNDEIIKLLKTNIDKQLKGIEELYDYYLIKLEEFSENEYYNRRLDELRIERRTYEVVLDMMENPEEYKGSDKE